MLISCKKRKKIALLALFFINYYKTSHKMKTRAASILLILTLFECCNPSTYLTGSWKTPDPLPKQYTSVLVTALTNNTIVKATLENDMALILTKSVTVIKGIDEFPPDIYGTDSSRINIMNKVKNKTVDCILTISILSEETETRYVPGTDPYYPPVHPYYNNFWGYYNYSQPRFQDQGYYVQNKVYFIETNLYDISTEKLIWSAQSRTYDPDNLESFSKEYADIITMKLQADGVIGGTLNKE
jgi:hypothetical protein